MLMKLKQWYKGTQINTLIVLIIGLMMLAAAAYESTISQVRQNEAVKWASHSFEILLSAERINSRISMADRKARETVYRQTPGSQEDFERNAEGLRHDIYKLRKLVADNPHQSNEVRSILQDSAGLIWHLRDIIALYRDVPGDIPAKMDSFKDVSLATGSVQTKLARMEAREQAFLRSRQQALGRSQTSATLFMLMFLLSGCGVIAFSFRSVMSANMTLAQKARLEEREARTQELMESEQRANEQARLLGALNSASANLASEHDVKTIVQDVVDYGVQITGAEFGAFFFLVDHNDGKMLHLEALSGIPRDHFPMGDTLPATKLFVSHNSDVLISEDVRQHELYGTNQFAGFPPNHPPVQSYIGIPIISTKGVQLGSMLLGHRLPNQFTRMHEESVRGLAGMTSIVIENARLYSSVQAELEDRKRYEGELVAASERQNLLLHELNHRVKNTLVTVQSIAMQTKNAAISKLGLKTEPERLRNLQRFYGAFESRLLSLSGTHDLLVNGAWGDVLLRDALLAALKPLIDIDRVQIIGPDIALSPNSAVTINMVFHELCTNAIKYGAASNADGTLLVEWRVEDDKIKLLWKESGGPAVNHPDGVGFGSKLLERAIGREMRGKSEVMFLPEGLECYMEIPFSTNIRLRD